LQTEHLPLTPGGPERIKLTYEGAINYHNLTFYLDNQEIAHFDTRKELLTPQRVDLPDGAIILISFLFGTSMPSFRYFPNEASMQQIQAQTSDDELYLYVPISRLIWLSVITFGCYTYYWIYKNWAYLKRRNMLTINPHLRGIFGILFCHSLLRNIRHDPKANAIVPAEFPNNTLATGWTLFTLAGMAMLNPSIFLFFSVFPFLFSFLFILPVQGYLNKLHRSMGLPEEAYYPFSTGHVLCLVGSWVLGFFILIIMSVLLGLGYVAQTN
jgi:hypothetical protein